MRRPALAGLLGLALALASPLVGAETDDADVVLGLADQALVFINEEDPIGLTDLMLEEAVVFAGLERPEGQLVRVTTRAQHREQPIEGDLVERGWDPAVMVSGSVAMVWSPYDLYVNDAWVHCGVDIFNFVKTDAGWRIATIVWSGDQPPSCALHPDGAPAGTTGTPKAD